MAQISQGCWDRVVKYIGLEQHIKSLVSKRDWRFEVARADINRLRFVYRCLMNETNGERYRWCIKRSKSYMLYLKNRHFKPALLHRLLLAELVCKLDRKRATRETKRKFAEYAHYIRQYQEIKRNINRLDPHRCPRA